MSEVKTVTPEELEKLKSIRNETDTFIIALGQIQYQKTLLDLQQDQIKRQVLESKEKEKTVYDELVVKYGNVSVDIESGTIS
jgi:hypothetical protein